MTGTGSLSLALLLALVSPALAARTGDDEEAAELLARAEEEAARGRYVRAVRLYEELAEDWPDTPAGRVGARRSQPNAFLGSTTLVDHGPSSNRVDVVLMGDGYTLDQQDAFDDLAADVPRLFERTEPFREYWSYLVFRRANVVSADDGVDGFGREEDTALGGYTRDTIQGHVGIDPTAVQRMLDELDEHDGLAFVSVRVGVQGSAFGPIAVVGGRGGRLTLHEWGHAFGGLGDEYADRTHDRGPVPEAPNVAATGDKDEVPWAHWIEAGAPGIGTYEGAYGQVRGAWRPKASGCLMGDGEFFCRPCREALVLSIYALVDPIESTSFPPYPFEHAASYELEDELELEVRVMQPRSHPLEVRWWVLPEADAPPPPAEPLERYRGAPSGDRRDRGPLPPIEAEPVKESRVNRTGVHELLLKAKDLAPGRYRVVCRARDTTQWRGERFPWVLRDDYGVLESERAWWIRVPEPGR